jgi:hypothetical protein
MKVGSFWLYGDGTLLVPVPGGPFTIGRQGGLDNPERQMNLADFWIYRTKVTNAQFAYCVSQGQCTQPSLKDDPGYNDPVRTQYPVAGVTYDQAAAYCTFVHGRLPTEAEWEKTARGPDANIYPWGAGAPTCDWLNFETCTGNTTPVNQYPQGQSYYRALDMEGNAFEWVADWYKADYYASAPADDPLGPERGNQRSVRSSAFNSGGNQTPAYSRFFSNPGDHRANLGFRCVVDDPTYFAPFCDYPPTYGTDGGGDTQTTVACPLLGIKQSSDCNEGNASSIVTFTGPAGSEISVPPGCTPGGNSSPQVCTKDGTLSICSSCTVTTTGDPQCLNGYQYDPETKSCKGQPGSGQCLPGVVLGVPHRGPVLTTTPQPGGGGQCCQISGYPVVLTSGEEHRGKIQPICPPGFYFDGTECISQQIIYPYCKTVAVDLASCAVATSSACQPPPGGCGTNYKWNYNTCTCDCNGC